MLENNDEFQHSYQMLLQYIEAHRQQIKESTLIVVEKILNDIVINLKYVGNHYFMDITTFGFKGDSIAESTNSMLKTGPIKVDGGQSLDCSANNQLAIVEKKVHETN